MKQNTDRDMEMKPSGEDTGNKEKTTPRRRRGRLWRRVAGILLLPLLLVAAVLGMVALILTPERLTPLVEKYANEYLHDARMEVQRVELTIWKTFPHTELEIDRLLLLNTSGSVPPEADTIAAVERLEGRINLAELLAGRISVDHVRIVRPRVTVWTGADSISNIDIFPAAAEKEESSAPLLLPGIRLRRFLIEGEARLRYISEPDSIDASLAIRQTELTGSEGQPRYRLSSDGHFGARPWTAEALGFGLDGEIDWDTAEPMRIGLKDFKVDVDSLHTVTNLTADFSDKPTIETLHFELRPVALQRLADVASQLPAFSGFTVPAVTSTARVALALRLLAPYQLHADSIMLPDMEAEVNVSAGRLRVPAWYVDFTRFAMQLQARIKPQGADFAIADLKRLEIAFPGSEFSLSGKVSHIASDPKIEGRFDGRINFDGINKRVWQLAGMSLGGRLSAGLDFRLRRSDLTKNTFHRARIDGLAEVRDLAALLPDDTISAWTSGGHLRFGTSGGMTTASGHQVDSLLRVSLSLDSARLETPDLHATLSGLRMGFGCENRASSSDTTTLTPMGARIESGLIRCMLADSTRAVVRDLSATALLTRYEGDGRRPLVAAKIEARRIIYADSTTRTSLGDALIAAKAHLANPKKGRRQLTAADSLRMKHRRDSLIAAEAGEEHLDFGVDRSLVRMLRKWDVRGTVKAGRARLRSQAFPLRMSMKNLDFSFNPDSLMLNSVELKAGKSDFSLNGSVTNMQRALGRRYGGSPLNVDFRLESDTININQLVQATFGRHARESAAQRNMLDADETDDLADTSEDAADDSELMAVAVPSNIDANLSFRARNIIYSNMLLHDFSGDVIIGEGGAYLRDLQARTDIGSAALNVLYYAPTVNDVEVGMSMRLNRFRIGRVTELMPALDTIMPLLRGLGGVIDVNLGATTGVDSAMNIEFPSLRAMMKLTGDSLKVLDEQTFKTMSKWLMLRDKKKNMIDHMEVELAIHDNLMELYPFMFDFDRYRIGVMGHNDLDMNLNYHVSVLKSPLPFKFGINIKGTADNMKIRPGKARFKENMAVTSVALADTMRLNLARELRQAIRRGTKAARIAPMDVKRPDTQGVPAEEGDTLSRADSLYLMREGLIEEERKR